MSTSVFRRAVMVQRDPNGSRSRNLELLECGHTCFVSASLSVRRPRWCSVCASLLHSDGELPSVETLWEQSTHKHDPKFKRVKTRKPKRRRK